MWALITGATSGIGYEIAKMLAGKGINLIIVSRNTKRMNEIVSEFTNVKVLTHTVDLSQNGSAAQLFDKINQQSLVVDILINNSGFGLLGEFYQNDVNRIEEMIQLNVMSLTILTKLFSDQMAKRKNGYIMNIASTAAFQAIPYFGVYSASKSFVRNFTLSLYDELKASNIFITNVNPGSTKTNFFEVANTNKNAELYNVKYTMKSEDVAKMALKAMFAGKREITTGFVNKMTSRLMPLVPIKLVYNVMKKVIK